MLKLLIDEQVNPRVAKALREKGVYATSIHDLGLAGTGLDDEAVLELAINRGETILSLDADFLQLHDIWIGAGKTHYGIFYGNSDKYQNAGAIGILVAFCFSWHELIEGGAAILEKDLYNKIEFISEVR